MGCKLLFGILNGTVAIVIGNVICRSSPDFSNSKHACDTKNKAFICINI